MQQINLESHKIYIIWIYQCQLSSTSVMDYSEAEVTNKTPILSTTPKITKRFHEIDTTSDLIIGLLCLVLAMGLTFICCVTVAAKCSKGKRPSQASFKLTSVRSNDVAYTQQTQMDTLISFHLIVQHVTWVQLCQVKQFPE